MRNTQIASQVFNKEQLPSGWRIVLIGDVLVNSQYGTNEASDSEGNIPIVGMKDIQDGKVLTDNLIKVNLSKDEQEKYRLEYEDLLFNRTNSIDLVGKVGLFRGTEPTTFASYLVRLQVDKKNILPLYLNYWLNGFAAQKAIKRIATRAIGQANVNPTEFKKHCFVPLAPIPEQKKIVEILCKVEQSLDHIERLIFEKQELRKGLMQQLLTEKKRLQGFTTPWKTVRLGEVFNNRVESNRSDLPLLAITGDRGVIPRDQINRKDSSSSDKSRYLRVYHGDIGYNTMRMWQGVSALSKLDGIVSPAYTIVTPKNDVDGQFMALLFKFPQTIHLFFRYSQGLVSDTLNLKFNNFVKIQIKIPEKTEQMAIAKVFRKLDEEISLIKQILDAIREQRRGLIQKLLTGRIRVKVPGEKTS